MPGRIAPAEAPARLRERAPGPGASYVLLDAEEEDAECEPLFRPWRLG
ncbi:hypothetical protein [Kitasatospora sp. NPDC096204]